MPSPSINLGAKVRDKITGFTGIVTSRTEWLNGCLRYGVQPQELHDGKPIDAHVFDEPQLEVLEASTPKAPPQPGGDRNDDRLALSR